ncbi:MAG: sugar ABC transporter ATP-binding protein [Alphaproteobacteria bacterium]
MVRSQDKNPIVSVKNIGKVFGSTRVLDDISFDFYPGEIFAMVGANGAGKSTLIKVICGYYLDHEGSIVVEGKNVRFSSPQDAWQKGIATVHQLINQGVIQNMTVAQNLALSYIISAEQNFWYRPRKIKEYAKKVAQEMELTHLDLDMRVSDLTQSDRQLIAIARALVNKPKLLILDEPTAAISEKETEHLFKHLFRLKERGVSILYVSHRLHEIERIADKVGVIRDGCYVGTLKRPFKVKDIVEAMVGDMSQHHKHTKPKPDREIVPILEVEDLQLFEHSPKLNFKIWPNEILGLTGLVGAGKTRLAQILFGLDKAYSGMIKIKGEEVDISSIAKALENGIHMIPKDRANKAVISEQSIRKNMSLPFLKFFSYFGLLRHRKEHIDCSNMIKRIGIKCSGDNAFIESLSGGNQQKVIVSRWLMNPFNIIILDEPYQGVDIKSRFDINQFLLKNIEDKAALIITADIDECLEATDRVIVVNQGYLIGEQETDKADKDKLLYWATAENPSEVNVVGRI